MTRQRTKVRKTMRAKTFRIRTDAENAALGGGSQVQVPFFRLSNCGCGIPRCNCSPERFICVSNGYSGITLELTPDEFDVLRKAFRSRSPEVWVDLAAGEKVRR